MKNSDVDAVAFIEEEYPETATEFKRIQKEPSYWEVLDSVEKFMVVFMVTMIGFFTYLIFFR